MFVVITLKDNATLLNGDGDITVGRVFIAKPTDNDYVVEALGVIVGRTITMFKNPLSLAANPESVFTIQTNVPEEWVNPEEFAK